MFRNPDIPIARRLNTENKWQDQEIAKIHYEILQLENQRFVLTTTALVFFGTVSGWVITTVLSPASRTVGVSTPVVTEPMLYLCQASTVLVWLVLYILFRYQLSLALSVRWLAAYLMFKGSDWEWNWHVFRRQHKDRRPTEMPF